MARTVTLRLTRAQVLVVNEALALLEATPELDTSPGVLERTRERVLDAIEAAGIAEKAPPLIPERPPRWEPELLPPLAPGYPPRIASRSGE